LNIKTPTHRIRLCGAK